MASLFWLAYGVGLVAAGGGGGGGWGSADSGGSWSSGDSGGGGGGGWSVTISGTTWYHTETYTTTTTIPVPTTTTTTVPVPTTTTTTIPVPTTTTETVNVTVPVPTEGPPVYISTTFTEECHAATFTETETSLGIVIDTSYITSLTTEPAVTIFITSTFVETDTLPPATVTSTEVTTALRCEFCKIDLYATALVFPTVYTSSLVYATTYGIYSTVLGPNETVYSTETIYAPTKCIQTPATTWTWNDVVLTSPTTYIGYTSFTHFTLQPNPTVYGCGDLVSDVLDLGPSATDFVDLVWATTAIPASPTTAQSEVLSFLDTIPTVVAQLDGVPAHFCDTPTVIVSTPEATETVTLAATTDAATSVKHKNQQPLSENSPTGSTSASATSP